jgi:hypothetical protein
VQRFLLLDGDPLPSASRSLDGVRDDGGAISILEVGPIRRDGLPVHDGVEEVVDLVDDGVLVADDVAGGPPDADIGVVALRQVTSARCWKRVLR